MFVTELSSFDSVIPNTAGFKQLAISLISSILDNKLFNYLNSFWFVFFFQFFFVKLFKNFFVLKITNYVHVGRSVFNFFNHKNFFRPIWDIAFCKNVFIFWYSNNTTNLNLGSSSLMCSIESIYLFDSTSTGFIFILLWYLSFF